MATDLGNGPLTGDQIATDPTLQDEYSTLTPDEHGEVPSGGGRKFPHWLIIVLAVGGVIVLGLIVQQRIKGGTSAGGNGNPASLTTGNTTIIARKGSHITLNPITTVNKNGGRSPTATPTPVTPEPVVNQQPTSPTTTTTSQPTSPTTTTTSQPTIYKYTAPASSGTVSTPQNVPQSFTSTGQKAIPVGNTQFAPTSSLAVVAKRFGIPMTENTHGQTAVFYAGEQNGVPQVAKYSNTGQFLGTYAQSDLAGKIPTIGSIAGGTYKAPGSYSIPA